MKFSVLIYCFASLFAQAEFKSDFDLEELNRIVEEDRLEARKRVEERDGVDGPWMLRLYADHRETGRTISDEEMRRIWNIYENTDGPRLGDKMYAFSLIAEFEDVTKWRKEFDRLSRQADSLILINLINLYLHKIDDGTGREKIILSQESEAIDRLVRFAEANKDIDWMRKDAGRIREVAEKYAAMSTPEVQEGSSKRRSGNFEGEASNHEISGNLLLEKRSLKKAVFWVVGLCVLLAISWMMRFRRKRTATQK